MKKNNIKKFTRILSLLYQLETGRVNLRFQAKELGFSQRTLERDMHEIEAAGFPLIETSPGCYRFLEGISLKKLPLSARDNALFHLMGQLAESLGPQWIESFHRLRDCTARPEGKDCYFVKIPRMRPRTISPRILEPLEQAILTHKSIDIYYQTPERKVTCRQLRPLKIALFDGFWYLITLNTVNTYMKFSLDKILKVCLKKDSFKPVFIEDKLNQSPNIWFDQEAHLKVKLKVGLPVARYFQEVEFLPEQNIEQTLPDGSLIISCKTANYMQLLPTIKRWLPYIEVLAPKELNKQLKEELKAYLNKLL